MKTLQNDFTTPEQSKRLLELGVPADSADMLWDGCVDPTDGWLFEDFPIYTDKPFSYYQLLYMQDDAIHILPCWSVGRLIEIAHICSDSTLSYKEEANEIQKFKEEHKCETLIDAVVACITDAVSIGSIDFSKLEE